MRARIAGIRAGELGSLPIIVGIILIAIYFQSRNDNFLTAGNFVNLIAQMSAIAVIGMGIVFVLLLGEIDLSVGFVSGVGGVICALLLIPDGNQVSPAVAIAAAIAAGRRSARSTACCSRRSAYRRSSSRWPDCSRGTASSCS